MTLSFCKLIRNAISDNNLFLQTWELNLLHLFGHGVKS